MDDRGPGISAIIIHATGFANTRAITPDVQADLNMIRGTVFIEANVLPIEFEKSMRGAEQMKQMMDSVMLHILGETDPNSCHSKLRILPR